MLYSHVLGLMKVQSLLHLNRYMASAVEGAICFETVLDGVYKTDRFDLLKLTEAVRLIIPLVERYRSQVRALTRDIGFPLQQ